MLVALSVSLSWGCIGMEKDSLRGGLTEIR